MTALVEDKRYGPYDWNNPKWSHYSTIPRIAGIWYTSPRAEAISNQRRYDHKMIDIKNENERKETVREFQSLLRQRGRRAKWRKDNNIKELPFDEAAYHSNALSTISTETLRKYQMKCYGYCMKELMGSGWQQKGLTPLKVCFICFFLCRFH